MCFLFNLYICDWWVCMNEGMENLKQIEELEEDKKNLYKVVDKLENRISTLEKVLESHAKCIGAIRKICDE